MNFRSSVFSVWAAVVVGLGAWGLGPAVTGGGTARADDVDDVLKHCTAATEEEVRQILFVAEISLSPNPSGVSYELHNPFRNKTIEGLIIRLEFKDPKVSDKEVSIDVFVRDHCAALQSSSGTENFFRAGEAGRGPVKITLKEVFFAAQQP